MEQEGIAGGNITQVGRDFIQKVFDLNISKKNITEFNILNPDDSEIRAYLSYWETLNSEHRITLVLNCRKYIKETYSLKTSKTNDKIPLKNIIFTLFIPLFLLVQSQGNRDILLKFEYVTYSNVVHKYCEISKDTFLPKCATLEQKNKTSQNLERELENNFKNYKTSWFEFIVSSLIIPSLTADILTRIIVYPFNILHKNKLTKENELIKKERIAKEQTYNVLFNLLNESEQSKVRDLENFLELQEIKDKILMVKLFFNRGNAFQHIEINERWLEDNERWIEYMLYIIKYIPISTKLKSKKSIEEIIAYTFPQLNRELIVKILNKYE